MKFVPGFGPASAKLIIVGEAPGENEERLGRPFVGKSGELVNTMLSDAGLDRAACYVTNVVKHRPPGNDIKKLSLLGKSISDYLPQLWAEIEAIKPNAILTFGNTPLEALTGYKEITKYRGSILPALRGNYKVIPTIHPASLLHSESDGRASAWKDLTFIQWDVNRAVEESRTKEYSLPFRNLTVCKSALTLYRFLDRFQKCDLVATDIETFKTIPVCISFAFNSTDSISVPLLNHEQLGMSRTDLVQCWKDVADILANPRIRKIGQNFKFDQLQLERCNDLKTFFGLTVRNFYFDTHLAFRTLYCELPASLAFIASVLTKEPYYKEEGKGYNPKKDKLDRLLLYNAKDSSVTFECYERELEELRERKLDEFFFREVMPNHSFYSRMENRGIIRDARQHSFLREKYELMGREKQEELNELVKPYGIEAVNVNSSGMDGQVGKLIYEAMEIPPRTGTDEKTLQAILRNEKKIEKDERKRRILQLVLEIRKVRKTISTYINCLPHADGKLRTGCRIMLESGRTSTSVLKPPVTTTTMGFAFQTLTKHGDVGTDLRSMYVAPPGYIFIEPDLSQAEARVVAVLARDEKLLKMFRFGVDIHLVTTNWMEKLVQVDDLLTRFFLIEDREECKASAKEINRILKGAINEELRQTGKKARHAGHYDMGKREASVQMGIPEWKANQFLLKFHASNDKIKKVFHKEIQEALKNNDRKLMNPFGRERQFLNKWGQELFKEAYAQIPQSTVSDQTKRAMRRIEQRAPWIEFLSESHDSFLAQLPEERLEEARPIVKEELESPIDFNLCTLSRDIQLVIPSDLTIGYNWEKYNAETNPKGMRKI